MFFFFNFVMSCSSYSLYSDVGDDGRECAIECTDKIYYWWWRSIIVWHLNKTLFRKCKHAWGQVHWTGRRHIGNDFGKSTSVFVVSLLRSSERGERERERGEESLHFPVLRTSVACLLEQVESNSQGMYSLFIVLESQAQYYAIGSCLMMWKY